MNLWLWLALLIGAAYVFVGLLIASIMMVLGGYFMRPGMLAMIALGWPLFFLFAWSK